MSSNTTVRRLFSNKEVKMIGKVAIDEAKEKRIIDKAAHLGAGEGVNYGA
jgi:hypothetical protein